MHHAPIQSVPEWRGTLIIANGFRRGNGDVSGKRFQLVGFDRLDKNGVERNKVFGNGMDARIARLSESVVSDIMVFLIGAY
jgi:hypothetical protein